MCVTNWLVSWGYRTNDSELLSTPLMMTRQGQNSEPASLFFFSFNQQKFESMDSMGHWASFFFFFYFSPVADAHNGSSHFVIHAFSFFIFFPHPTTTDDPYYCGLRARVSNFVKNKNTKEPVKESGTEIKMKMTPHVGTYQAALSHGHPMQAHQMWHSRSFDSGMGNWLWHLSHIFSLLRAQRSLRPLFARWHVLWYYGVALNHDGCSFFSPTTSHTQNPRLIRNFPFSPFWLASA